MDAPALVLLILIALAPPIILVVRLRNAEQRRREPWRVVFRAFVWGAVPAAFAAVLLESFLEPRMGDATLILPVLPVTLVVMAPFVEELSKAIGLRLIRDRDPEPEDGYIYGGAVGLGFGATENVFYILTAFLVSGQDGAFVTALYRGIVTVPLHGAVSAIAGRGIWRARYGGSRWWALWGVGAAILIHVAYNALSKLALGWATLAAAALAVIVYMRIVRRITVLDARPHLHR